MLLRQILDPRLAQYAYLVGCQKTKEAVIIDPERDIDQYVSIAESEGLVITAVAETHIHADFLSGARQFAEQYGTKLYLSDEGAADGWASNWAKRGDYDVTILKDGDSFMIGNIELQAIHTPGHTPEHLSYKITDHGGGADQAMGLVTGDFVFVGDLGRPDLLESAAKVENIMRPSAQKLFTSATRFLDFDDYLQVWPGHGAGSACGKALGAVPQTTVGYERRFNAMLDATRQGENVFVDTILDGQPEPPLYFARMKMLNRDGVPVLNELPKPSPLSADEINVVLNGDTLIVDARMDRIAFAQRHLPGSLYAPFDKQFNTTVGSLVTDPEAPIVLVIPESDVEQAVRDLIRIGYDRIPYYITPDVLTAYFNADGTAATIERVDFEGMIHGMTAPDTVVLDVRRKTEYDAGHVPGSINAAHTRLPELLDKIPTDKTLLVHCQSGGRSALASAYLVREGYTAVYVDDNFPRYREIGPVEEVSLEPVA